MADTFTPEQITQILEEFFKVVGTRKYIGERYVPIFGRKGEESIQWDNSAPYEPLTIVLYQGNSYTSRQYVPIGVEITNQEFWVITGNYNAQVEAYHRETIAAREIADNAITTANNAQNDINTLLPKADFNAENTVKKYIDENPTRILAFDTVADMQAAINLLAGMTCHTNGFHAIGDGGAAYYTVSANGTANGMDVLALQGGLYAALLMTGDHVTPEMFGAYGDDTHDDSASMDAATKSGYPVHFCNDYYIGSQIHPDEASIIYGNSHTLRLHSGFYVKSNSTLSDIKFDFTYVTGAVNHLLLIYNAQNVTLDNLTFNNVNGDAFAIFKSSVIASNIRIDRGGRNGISVVEDSSLTLENFYIGEIEGKAPQIGIDIEPNTSTSVNTISLRNGVINNTNNFSMYLALRGAEHNIDIENITVNSAFFGLPAYGYLNVSGLHVKPKKNTVPLQMSADQHPGVSHESVAFANIEAIFDNPPTDITPVYYWQLYQAKAISFNVELNMMFAQEITPRTDLGLFRSWNSPDAEKTILYRSNFGNASIKNTDNATIINY